MLTNAPTKGCPNCHYTNMQGFARLCVKSVNPSSMIDLFNETIITMCMLERVLPSTFFDVVSHLPIHLVQQLDNCGLVHIRWMYPMERYLKTLKGYVRLQNNHEGSMTQGYIMDEAIGFCTKYMQHCFKREKTRNTRFSSRQR